MVLDIFAPERRLEYGCWEAQYSFIVVESNISHLCRKCCRYSTKNYFLMRICFKSWKIFYYRRISVYVCWVLAKHADYALMKFIMVVEEIRDGFSILSFLWKAIRHISILNHPLNRKCFSAWSYDVNIFVIDMSDQHLRSIVLFSACDRPYNYHRHYDISETMRVSIVFSEMLPLCFE